MLLLCLSPFISARGAPGQSIIISEEEQRKQRKRKKDKGENVTESEKRKRKRKNKILHGDSCALGEARSNHAREIYGACFRVPLLSAGINIISNRLIPI